MVVRRRAWSGYDSLEFGEHRSLGNVEVKRGSRACWLGICLRKGRDVHVVIRDVFRDCRFVRTCTLEAFVGYFLGLSDSLQVGLILVE